jgi:hypothetical protein
MPVVPAPVDVIVGAPVVDARALAVEVAVQDLAIVLGQVVAGQPAPLAQELPLLTLKAPCLLAGQAAVPHALLDPLLLYVFSLMCAARPASSTCCTETAGEPKFDCHLE